jgi:predicted secreted protein
MRSLVLILGIILVSAAQAQKSPADDMTRTRVQIEARATAEVGNDTMRANLFAEMEDVDPAKLADRINRATGDALKVLKNTAGLRVRSGGYNTYPISEKGKILRWRARSDVIVEGQDFRQVSEAIGKVQAGVQLGAWSSSPRRPRGRKSSRASPRLQSRNSLRRQNSWRLLSRAPLTMSPKRT